MPVLKVNKAISSYWRTNRSRQEADELALALRALRKVAGHLGRNVKPVFWKGMAEDDGKSILIDPAACGGKYPVAPLVFDALTGEVVMGALSSMEWTEWVRKKAAESCSEIPAAFTPFVAALVSAGEVVYAASREKPPVWNLYLEAWLRRRYAGPERDPGIPPDPDSLAGAWLRKVLLGERREGYHFYYEDVFACLEGLPGELAAIAGRSDASERREQRARLYRLYSAKLFSWVFSNWEEYGLHEDSAVNLFDPAGPQASLPPDDEAQEEKEDSEDDGEPDQNTAGKPGLAPEVLERINEILATDEEAKTLVAVAVADPEAAEMPVRFVKGAAVSDVRPDPMQSRRLAALFREHEKKARLQRRRAARRGLSQGNLDVRRLFRAGIDGRVFKMRQAPSEDPAFCLTIVADASASMGGKGLVKPWAIAEKTFASLAAASRGYQHTVKIFSYHESERCCTLTDLFHGNKLYTVSPGGRTPSGQAILAAASSAGQARGKRVLIHITDGAANCGAKLSDAIAYCRSKNIEIYTIGCGVNRQTREFLRSYFPPESIFFLTDIRYLAAGIERLLRRRMLAA
ncbi:MAG: VWA domain-containing protein [Thermodesulfobacteriota bacterium]